jgi:hypothetical protein
MNIHEKSALALIHGGADALAAIDTVTERLAELQVRAKVAEQDAENARQGRRSLVHRAAIGEVISPSVVAKADKSVADAEGIATLAREAVQAGRVAVAEAEGEASALIAVDRSRRFREAAERRIQAAEELDRLGAEYGRAAAEFLAAGEAIVPFISFSAKSDQQIASIRNRRAVRDAVPASIQQIVVQTGSAVNAPIAPRERGLWT